MRRAVAVAVILSVVAAACAKSESKPKPLDVPGQKVYEMKGKIVARDAGDNTVRVDHEAIPGYMEAMTMDYSVRGANVLSLPENNAPIVAKLHVTDGAYWLTDVRKETK